MHSHTKRRKTQQRSDDKLGAPVSALAWQLAGAASGHGIVVNSSFSAPLLPKICEVASADFLEFFFFFLFSFHQLNAWNVVLSNENSCLVSSHSPFDLGQPICFSNYALFLFKQECISKLAPLSNLQETQACMFSLVERFVTEATILIPCRKNQQFAWLPSTAVAWCHYLCWSECQFL